LHGHTGPYRSWVTYAGLPADTATSLGAIVVLADGGNGFYVNWHGAEGYKPNRWQDAIVHDLLPEVERRWRTRRERGARAIGGLSMGGYGAITIALRHPDVFGIAFSSAGALRFAERARQELESGGEDWNRPELWSKDENAAVPIAGFSTQRERTPRGRVFVDPAQTRQADPFVLVDAMTPARAPYLHLDCGLQDSLCPETRGFAARLRDRGIAHSYLELPGDHDAPYWTDAFAHTALILKAALAGASPAHSTSPRAMSGIAHARSGARDSREPLKTDRKPSSARRRGIQRRSVVKAKTRFPFSRE